MKKINLKVILILLLVIVGLTLVVGLTKAYYFDSEKVGDNTFSAASDW